MRWSLCWNKAKTCPFPLHFSKHGVSFTEEKNGERKVKWFAQGHIKKLLVESEIKPTLSDSLRALDTMCPFFLYFTFSSLLCLTFQAAQPFFVNPQKLYRVTITGHTPYQISAMYEITIAALTQSSGLGKNKWALCPIISYFLLFDVMYTWAIWLMANG